MSLRDRGAKKWTSIMLPEHVEKLKEVFAEDDYKEKPIIDDQQKMENDALIQMALHEDLEVEIKYFEDYDYHTVQGHILFIDHINKIIKMADIDIRAYDVIRVTIT